MRWDLLQMEAPLFGGDKLYNSILAIILLIVGLALVMKAGKKIGWLFVAGAFVWGYLTFKDLLFM